MANEVERVKTPLERLIAASETSLIWLRGALNCKDWQWDADQHEAATESYEELSAAIAAMKGEAVPVALKALEWKRSDPKLTLTSTETIIGKASVWTHHETEDWFWGVGFEPHGGWRRHGEASTKAAAMEAAEKAYREEIAPALTAPDATRREAFREGLNAAADWCAKNAEACDRSIAEARNPALIEALQIERDAFRAADEHIRDGAAIRAASEGGR